MLKKELRWWLGTMDIIREYTTYSPETTGNFLRLPVLEQPAINLKGSYLGNLKCRIFGTKIESHGYCLTPLLKSISILPWFKANLLGYYHLSPS